MHCRFCCHGSIHLNNGQGSICESQLLSSQLALQLAQLPSVLSVFFVSRIFIGGTCVIVVLILNTMLIYLMDLYIFKLHALSLQN